MIKFVQQRTDWDCVIACLAMWTDRSYEQVYHDCCEVDPKKDFEGRGVDGYIITQVMKKWGMLRAVMMDAPGGVPGMLSFPSLNVPGGSHALFYDGRYIHDPQKGREGKKWHDLELKGLWPGSYNITIDLNHEYSRTMYEIFLNGFKHQLDEAKK